MSAPRWRTRPVAAAAAAASIVTGSAALGACADAELGALSPRGPAAAEISWLFWLMVGLGVAVFVLVVALAVAAVRATSNEDDDDGDTDGDTDDADNADDRRSIRLVLGGGVLLPIVVLVPLTVAMMVVADRIAPRTADAELEIRVVGHKFWWEVEYLDAGVVTANEIHIPTDTRVRFELESADVIHSFWVPQLGGKIDMIPGETTELTISATEAGTYLGQCAEFCGVQHARMRFLVIAQPMDEFEAWLGDQAGDASPPPDPAAERGQQVFAEMGCAGCHTVRGTGATGDRGPDLTHVASRRTLGAATRPNTRGELSQWITDPHEAKPGNLMPATPLADDDLDDLIAYLEALE